MNPQVRKKVEENVKRQFAGLVGRTIKEVIVLNDAELKAIGFDDYIGYANPTIALILDDGSGVVPMADPEGNGPGWLELLELMA